ncbi:Helix-turn-helix domain-containing protein [Chryseobacterium arachidis]|uniref:Helix-turn-helix domain-containing protein n=2 Tax=Chryseobacterium arachidis TaxID=1416778 RepID=A0A1M4XA53_9FLAO|nr:Helix-turn-helix domain-containing protein [Chryseobacterium arachidis]
MDDPECFEEYLLLSQVHHFNVFNRSEICEKTQPLHRSDFYKISLIKGRGILQVRDELIEINGNVLIFFNPTVPYFWQTLAEETPSYYCYFDNQFQTKLLNKDYFQKSALFTSSMNPIFSLTDEQAEDVRRIFESMLLEINSEYHYRYDIIATYLQLLLQKAYKFQNISEKSSANKPAAIRLTSKFLNMLENQFPIDSLEHSLKLKTPNDFANELSIHVNHLNYVIKEVTSKSTSEIIASRVLTEAKALLNHSNFDISEIAYLLGFEYPSNFITFFKRHTKETPKSFRKNSFSNIQNI